MRRKFVILLGIAALVTAAGIVQLRGLHERRLVASWTTDVVRHWDFNLSWRANQERRREGLRSIAPIATKILRKNLNYESPYSRWHNKLPVWPASWLDTSSSSGGPSSALN